MVRTETVSRQLKSLGINFRFFGKAELRELPHILFDDEEIKHLVLGRYEGGWAVLCATNQRVLLIDKKPFYLTIEDMRYDMIADVEFNHRLLDATVRLGTVHKTLRFTVLNHAALRLLTNFIQQQVMSFRQRQITPEESQQQFQQQFQQQYAQAQQQHRQEGVYTDQALGQSAMQGMVTQPPVFNPYNVPVMIRRRVSRFY